MSESRIKNVSLNMVVALICQLLNLIVSFISRTYFIKLLGVEYLGINGLFTNILTILSFAELGIGNAIIFNMYKPLAINDVEQLKSLMFFYKKAYHVIGIVVAIVGVCVIPFLNLIINDSIEIIENISIIYILFLTNTVVSYFFVYKKSIIIADQKNFIVLVITEIIHVIQVATQIICLYLTHNFPLYLLLQICGTILNNLIVSFIADKKYPYLKEKAQPLSRGETERIFKNVKALTVYKFGSVILNGTDNILVSSLVGVKEVGLVSNYVLLNASCNAIVGKVTEAFTASVGNLNAVADEKKKYDIFKKVFFVTAWLYGFASIGLLMVASPFVVAWIGEDYLLNDLIVFSLILGFYVQGVHFAAYTYRTTLGLFEQGQVAPLLAAGLNIIFSIFFCQWVGLAGIFIATPLSRILTTGIIDPILIYRKAFHVHPIVYYIQYIAYLLLFFVIGIFIYWILTFLNISGWIGVFVRIILTTVIFNGIIIIVFLPTKIFKECFKGLKSLINKK